MLYLCAKIGLLAQGPHNTLITVLYGAALAREYGATGSVHVIVAQIAKLTRAIHLCRDQFDATQRRRPRFATINVRFLAAFDQIKNVADQILLVKRPQGVQ
jgi:hypothetical protein